MEVNWLNLNVKLYGESVIWSGNVQNSLENKKFLLFSLRVFLSSSNLLLFLFVLLLCVRVYNSNPYNWTRHGYLCRVLSFYCNYSYGICRYTLNIWDVGGQRTIRSYWRNYFEQTDGLVWVVDSSDLRRLDDCKFELDNLLKEEVSLTSVFFLVF